VPSFSWVRTGADLLPQSAAGGIALGRAAPILAEQMIAGKVVDARAVQFRGRSISAVINGLHVATVASARTQAVPSAIPSQRPDEGNELGHSKATDKHNWEQRMPQRTVEAD